MIRSVRVGPLRLITSLVAVAFLLAPTADAQRKKPKKKPAASAMPKSAPAKPAPPEAAPPAPAAAEPPPEAEPEPMPAKKTKPPKAEEAEEKPTEPTEEERDKAQKPDKDKGGKQPSLLDAELGMKGFQRHLAYQNDVNNVLPDYDLSGAPAVAINVGIYPIRTATGSITAGLTGGFENAFSIGTTYRDPQAGQQGTHTTRAMAYSVGGRVNFAFGTNTVGVGGEYGVQKFTVDLPDPTLDNAQVPDVEYQFIRPNVAARFGLANRISLLASLGYLYIISAGEIVSARYFRGPATSASGFDINAGVAWAPLSGSLSNLELRPMLGWRRIAFKFTPGADPAVDPYVATGAHDDYLSLSLMVGFRM
jgi:hypothetical protein